MSHRLLVIGGGGGGMGGGATARRRGADFEIVALEQGRHTSYSACGIPYVISGDVWALDELVVRPPQQFRDQRRTDWRTGPRAMSIAPARAPSRCGTWHRSARTTWAST